jgi:hypothetical protein
MNIMVAALDTTLESPLARGLSNAAWYLVFDQEKGTLTASPTLHCTSLDELLPWLSGEDISAVLVGSEGAHSRILLSSNKTLIEFADRLTVGEAIQRWEKGDLALLSAVPENPADPDTRPGPLRLRRDSME